jgi:hypothetical protein
MTLALEAVPVKGTKIAPRLTLEGNHYAHA